LLVSNNLRQQRLNNSLNVLELTSQLLKKFIHFTEILKHIALLNPLKAKTFN
jgi:hypothetical protein